MLHVVVVQILLGIVYVRGAVNILDAALLAGLRPLAGEQDDRGLVAAHHGLLDGFAAVGDDGVVAGPLGHVLGDVPADVLHRLLAGVLLGQDDQVGILPGNFAQVLPPVIGLVAGAAEHGDDPAAGVLLPHRAEERLEGQTVVGIVHDHTDLFVRVGVDFHAARHAGLHEAGKGILLWHAHGLAHGQGRQGVLDVEQTRHGQPELPAVPGGLHAEQNVSPGLSDLGAKDGGGGVRLGEGDDAGAALPGRFQHPVGVVAVQVHAGGGGLGEDAELGGKVVLKVRVLDGRDMVHADVQEHSGGKLHVLHPVVFQRLAGDLHAQVPDAGRHGVGKVPLQLQGFGGGQVGLELLHAVIRLDAADDAAGRLLLGGQVLVKNILEVVGGGRFALRAGHAHHAQLGGGVVVIEIRQVGHSQTHVADLDAGQVYLVVLLLGQVDESALFLGGL